MTTGEPARCTDVVGPCWELGGESWACVLPATHVFDESTNENGLDRRAHRSDTGTWWYDDQQVDEARRWHGAS